MPPPSLSAEAVPSDAKQSRRQLTGHSDHIRPRDPQQTHCSTDFRWRVKNIEKSDPDEAAEQRQDYTNMFVKFVKYFAIFT